MKPKRMQMVHNMVVNYGLYKHMDVVVRIVQYYFKISCPFSDLCSLQKPDRLTAYQMTRFHSDEYINFLQRVTPDNVSQIAMQHGGLEQGIARCKLNFFFSLLFNIHLTDLSN